MRPTYLTYTLETADGIHYLASIDPKELEDREIYGDAMLELSSFGFHLEMGSLFCKNEIEVVLMIRLRELLEKHWDATKLGTLPVFKFTGAISKFRKEYTNLPMLCYFRSKNAKEELSLLNDWKEVVSFHPKFVFMDVDIWGGGAIISDHGACRSYLDGLKDRRQSEFEKLPQFNFYRRMKDWYKDTALLAKLRAAAKAELDRFVVAKSFDVYIPEFLVVPKYHVLRYQTAYGLIRSKFDPAFIMTLPIRVRNNDYTVLFPVTRKLSKKIHYAHNH